MNKPMIWCTWFWNGPFYIMTAFTFGASSTTAWHRLPRPALLNLSYQKELHIYFWDFWDKAVIGTWRFKAFHYSAGPQEQANGRTQSELFTNWTLQRRLRPLKTFVLLFWKEKGSQCEIETYFPLVVFSNLKMMSLFMRLSTWIYEGMIVLV